MRDYEISKGVLTYYEMAGHRNHTRMHYRWKRVGGDYRKPVWWLRIKGILWKHFGWKVAK